MRVYTNQTLVTLWAYIKFAAVLGVLFVLVSQGLKVWQNDPNLQEIRELISTSTEEQK